MVVDSREQAELLRDLRLALSRSQLELYYQPKIHAPSAQITGVEALLRWHHPQRGMISPNIFIPMAERSGLINALGAWVIDEACRQARVWRDQGMRMRVAINLSAYQLRQSDLPQHISRRADPSPDQPGLLTCEITESVAMEDTEATKRFFDELAAVGVHISIDDFGSGYSSLAYLRKLPAGELKIDRSFVLDLATQRRGAQDRRRRGATGAGLEPEGRGRGRGDRGAVPDPAPTGLRRAPGLPFRQADVGQGIGAVGHWPTRVRARCSSANRCSGKRQALRCRRPPAQAVPRRASQSSAPWPATRPLAKQALSR